MRFISLTGGQRGKQNMIKSARSMVSKFYIWPGHNLRLLPIKQTSMVTMVKSWWPQINYEFTTVTSKVMFSHSTSSKTNENQYTQKQSY